MIEEIGQVVGLDGRFAWVETERTAACSACSAQVGCGTSTLTKVLGNRRTRFKALNEIDAKPDSRVVVGISEKTLIQASALIYIVPLLLFFIFSGCAKFAGNYFGFEESDQLVIVFGLVGLSLGFIWLSKFSKKWRSEDRLTVKILRISD